MPNLFLKMPVFPISRSKVHILRRILNILRRRASARLQLLEALGRVGLVVAMCFCLSVFKKFLGLSLALRSHDVMWQQFNTVKNVTLNYWPSDHMIRSCQPVVASIPWKKTLHLTMGYWLLSSHVERVGDSRMRDFSLYGYKCFKTDIWMLKIYLLGSNLTVQAGFCATVTFVS